MEQTELRTLVTTRFERNTMVSETFFTVEAERIVAACWAMAWRFHQGGRLLAFGNGGWLPTKFYSKGLDNLY